MDLEQALARVAELEGQVTAVTGERDAAVTLGETLRGQLTEAATARDAALGQVTTLTGERDAASASAAAAQSGVLGALRRALVAENAGSVVPELIQGETAEALAASVEAAKSAYTSVVEATRAALRTVPVGAGSGGGSGAGGGEAQTPLQRMSAGFAARSGS